MPGVSEGDAGVVGQIGGLTESQVAYAVVNLHTLILDKTTQVDKQAH